MTAWAKAGFPLVSQEQLRQRLEICNACEHWAPDSAAGIGRCMRCGCTGIKLSLATSECPIGKWTKTTVAP